MRATIRQVFSHLVTVSVLLLVSAPAPAAQRPAENPWRVENATITAVPFVSELVDGNWVRRQADSNAALLEVQGTLYVDGDGSFGPLSLADVRLLSGRDGLPLAAELVAVGVGSVKCRYFPAQVDAGRPREATLGAGEEFALIREDAKGPVFLKARAPTLNLCMAFELVGPPPPTLFWRIANQPIALAIGSLTLSSPSTHPADGAATPSPIPDAASSPIPQTWRRALESPLLWGAAALTLLALFGGIALHRARRRREMKDGMSSEPASALDIPRVGPSHQPTTLTPVGPEAGPGRPHFQGALAALRLGEWTQANELFSKAIEAGLTPTYEAGAWSLRGDAMLNCDDLVGAATCFLRSLSCSAVTTESVLLSAGHLAAIYRELGFRRDASKMDKLKLLASPFGSDLGPQRLELIARLAGKFKHKRRARMLARINPFA